MPLSQTWAVFSAEGGIAPAVEIVRRLLDGDARNCVLVFCGTHSEEHAEPMEQLLALKDQHLDRLSLNFVMDREPQEATLLTGRLDAEKVSALAAKLFDPKAIREYFVCGSPQLAADVTAALTSVGVEEARIQQVQVNGEGAAADLIAKASERAAAFAAAPPGSAGRAGRPDGATSAESPRERDSAPLAEQATDAAAAPAAGETRVEFVMDGRRRAFTMRTGVETILDAAARAGIDLPFSCTAGVCATCRTKLVRGEVEMMQNYALEDWELEQGFILACQAHAKTPEIELNYDEK